MLTPERFNGLMNGKPGAIVNEDFSKERGWFLYYAYYDGNGKLAGYAEFPRNTSPQRMCTTFKNNADELLKNYPENMTWEEVVEEADALREMASNVPGLNTE